MSLVLKVVSGAPDIGRAEIEVGARCSLGRGEGNDVVLRDKAISRQHALIERVGDTYYLCDTSQNGTYLNSTEWPIGCDRRERLNPGDRISMGDYEFTVEERSGPGAAPSASGTGAPPAASGWDPFPRDDPGMATHGDHDPFRDDPLGADPFATRGEAFDDPVGGLGGAGEDDDVLAGLDRGAPRPPEDLGLVDGELLDGGDATNYAGARPASPVPGGPRSEPFPDPFAEPDPAPRLPPEPPEPDEGDPFGSTTIVEPGATDLHGSPAPGVAARPPPHAPASSPVPEPPRTAPPARGAEGGDAALVSLLRAAGLDAATARELATPELATRLGEALTVVVTGLMGLSEARNKVRRELGAAEHTIMGVRGNNPLKFSHTARDALGAALAPDRSSLGLVEALEDCLEDLKNHQIATVAGMEAGYEDLMRRFDPEDLERRFEDGRERRFLSGGRARKWDRFVAEYRRLKDERGFRDLFGRAFASRYDDEVDRLERRAASPQKERRR